jgi:biotin operon repressor
MDQLQYERLSYLFKALADPARLRILGLLAERPMAGHELANTLDLTPPTISHHIRKLVDAGLVAVAPEAQSRIYSLQTSVLREASQSIQPERDPGAPNHDDDGILRNFFDGERLRQIPAARKKRVIVLRRLLESFTPGRDYSEREVNDILLRAHEDYATLRRELVDYGFMTRDKGIYRVASALPARGPTVRQEVGNEARWFADLVSASTERALMGASAEPQTPLARPEQTL